MGYYHPLGKQSKLAKSYGVEGVNYGTKNNIGGKQIRTVNTVERDISAAMANDYSTREYLKYNDDVRDEANDIKSLRDKNAFINDSMKQAHKKAGNGGDYSSASDRSGVAQNSFEDYMSQYKMKGSGKKKKDKEPEEEQAQA